MLTIVIGIIAVVVLWPLSALYRVFGPMPLLALSGIAGAALFAWINGDARR